MSIKISLLFVVANFALLFILDYAPRLLNLKLHTKILGQGQPFIILHGLFGASDNWYGIGRTLSKNYQVFLVDARNHGHSPHSAEFSYNAMADDILEIVEDNSLENCILTGHSMGGKTAMKFAQNFPAYIAKLIVVDIAPKPYPVQNRFVLDALNSIDFPIVKSRKNVEQLLSKYIDDESIKQFLLKSLYWKNTEQLGWRFNLKTITTNIHKIGEAINDRIFDKPTLFIRGGLSDYITGSDLQEIPFYFPQASFVTIPDAQHWVHAEQPESFLKTILAFISE